MPRAILRLLLVLATSGAFAVCASAQGTVPIFVYVTAEYASTWAVGQTVPLGATVHALNSQQSTATPTGTLQFYANGQPVGSPVKVTDEGQGLSDAQLNIPFSTPGNYVLTGTYSGDATYASGSSTAQIQFSVEANPATLLPSASPASLTFAAGATTGNTLTVTMKSVNGCHCSAQWNTSITPVPGTSAPGTPATVTLVSEPSDTDGDTVYNIVISSTAPHTITTTTTARNEALPGTVPQAPLVVAAALLLLLPLTSRRLPRIFAVSLVGLLLLPGLMGCGGVSPPMVTTTSKFVPGSRGEYDITVAGEAFSPSTFTYFSVQIPVTIQ